ncbi:hypothetical protein I350_07467 [Cryptococcus amylolentus CBS 6273]|uniref:Uncharacterized protein n=1 Tax=Cryptococcus amylolentus CBS 6273 TaxID=1296118 RepID=A0A1E3JHA0_9TREE|nr:hypothetical protein I350_07467 [Cryptococcus amylolentus CBS 6273]
MLQSSISPHTNTNTTMSSQAFILPRASPSLSPSERQRPNHKTTTQLALGRLDPAVFWPKDAIRLIKHKPVFDELQSTRLSGLSALWRRWRRGGRGIGRGWFVGGRWGSLGI